MSSLDLSIFQVHKKCVVGLLPMSKEQRAAFDDACAETDYEEYPNIKIFRVLNEDWKIRIKKTSLAIHRRRECACYSDRNINGDNK